jgi:DEAD/DEAH box helicase domain-containing protein
VKIAKPFYASLTAQLNRRATRAVLGLLGFRNDALREYLRERFGQDPGIPGAFLADPVFEATFGWRQAAPSLADLSGSLLHPSVVRALAEPPKLLREEYTFPTDIHPYAHQLAAWQALIEARPPRSVLVSSGTGSGKTECFLIPILCDLAAEIDRRQGMPLTGVRAVFLYPLNALIKSQKDRLVAWSEPFGGGIRFCLYNGDTPEQGKSEWASEVADRRTLRGDPPPILVTNATMLEYLLVRNEDRPILTQSQGGLRWIVIDEAHTYIGSQAAELTLLLRRVLHAFGVSSEQVHFVATSATLGESSEMARRYLAEFLADVAGVPLERVSVIEGHRQVPELLETLRRTHAPHPAIDALRSLTPAQRFTALGGDLRIRDLRKYIVERPRPLGELARKLYDRDDAQSRRNTLDVLDLCTQAVNEHREPLLPLRGHVFQRTLNGLWACANPQCQGRKSSHLDNPHWPFGAVYLERRLHCQHCAYPVFELVLCGECGAEYLAAAETFREGKDWLEPWTEVENEDEFQQNLEPVDANQEEEAEEACVIPRLDKHPRLLATQDLATVRNFRLRQTGELEVSGSEGIPVHYCASSHDAEGIRCPVCKEGDKPERPFTLFKPIRVGAPFLLGTAIPLLLDHVEPFDRDRESRPLDGRRLITFTDSRQGTARFAAKLQQESERDYVRSLLYHHIADAAKTADPAQLAKLETEVAALEPLAAANPVIGGVLEQKRQELVKLQTPPLGNLAWEDAADKLLQNGDFKDWLLPGLRELAFGQLQDRTLARLCLLREFFLRPKRRFSLEGLGLLQLTYPALDQAVLPAVMRQRKLSDLEWRELLHVTIDFYLRGGDSVVAISHDTARWLGYPGYPTVQLPSNHIKSEKNQRAWPSAQSPQASRMKLIRLLAYAFNLSLEVSAHRNLLDEMLNAIWQGIRPLLSQTEDGFVLDLEKQAVVTQIREAWFCPVTRRLLPTTFRGISPYLPASAPDHLTRCCKFPMPRVPKPFWFGCEREEAEYWLETDPAILQLREIGAWSNISDRIARHSRYLRAVEHSAQIAGKELTRREDAFKQGKINLMSCSTTMEMGVDIGGLTGVAMNNVPPHPANFLQRAGRAGRRGETAAFSFTLCKATPHGEAVFRNPLWPFVTRLAMPRVEMRSAPIVQRHINALALAGFLRERAPERIHQLHTGWFFEAVGESSAPCDRFREWCQDGANRTGFLTEGVQALIRRSVLEGTAPTELLNRVAASAESVAERWRRELQALLDQQDAVKTQIGDSKAEVAIRIQLDRLRGEYLLGELATLGFLPGYGFPTNVVPFVTTTLEDVERRQREERKEREDNRSWRSGYPSRNLAIAIRDYAPGTDTVLDQRVYRSEGVTLNWHLPANAEGASEIQSLRYVWQCRTCGGGGTRSIWPERCPHCGESSDDQLKRHRFLQPAGFAVDLRCKPHNNVSTPQYIPVKEPLISLEGAEWMSLASVVRYRASIQGHIFQYSNGLYERGYALCLTCGRADSLLPDGRLPASFVENLQKQGPLRHKRLRGGRLNDKEKNCPGNDSDWSIQRGLWLGVVSWTDVMELQLRVPAIDKAVNDKAIAYTLAVALRRALCLSLGIEESEVGCATLPGRDAEKQPTVSLFLYDTASGGAGYATQAPTLLPELFRKAREILDCPAGCDSACQSCVLSYDTQHHLDHLNRHAALELLSSTFLDTIKLPDELCAFGEGSRLEMEPLALALHREWQRQPAQELRIYIGGDVGEWEPLAWRLRSDLTRWAESGARLRLIAPTTSLTRLNPSQRDELAALVAFTGTELYGADAELSTEPSALPLILELGSENQCVRWAATNSAALVPRIRWGSGDAGAQYIRISQSGSLPPLLGELQRLDPQSLRSVPPGLIEVRITRELDGPSATFGERAWALLEQRFPILVERLNGSMPLVDIRYTDRYLRSPFNLLLLHSLFSGLACYSGGLVSTTSIHVDTALLERFNTDPPRLINHDWQDGEDRRNIADLWFKESYPVFHWRESAIRDLPHARELELIWADGLGVCVRLDQGVGYWRVASQIRQNFPFESDAGQQIKRLCQLNIIIEPGSKNHPTYWYCGRLKQGST